MDGPPLPPGILDAEVNLVGTVIADRYEVQQKVGQGSMGAVYVARHKTLGSRFAVKVMLNSQDAEESKRFLSEARLASKVQHPNTVYIADFGMLPSGRFYLVMEFLGGSTLAAIIAQGPLPPARACAIAAQIAHGLSAVHKKGIIHRDLKPENIFLTEEEGRPDFVKIVDFGIAKAAALEPEKLTRQPAAAGARGRQELYEAPQRLTMPGSVLGTPDYMSPEQARGTEVDFRADQYALGCILYEMLCGSVPFSAQTLIGLLRRHMSDPPMPLAQRAPERKIPASLDSLVLRLLSKKPADRFESMQLVAQALEQEEARLRTPPPARRSNRLLGALLGGAVLLGVPLAVHYWPTPRLEQAAEQAPTPAELLAAKNAALAVLKEQLAAPARELRYAALGALSQSRDCTLIEPITALLSDPDIELAAQAAATLGQLGDRRPIPKLRALVTSAPLKLRLSVARALLDLGDEQGRPVLSAVLSRAGSPDMSAETSLQAAFFLCDTDDAAAQRLLGAIADLETTQVATVLDILTCLGRSAQPTLARQKLLARFRAHHGADRIPLAARLAQLGEQEGRDFLRELASRPGPEQLAAACALAGPAEDELAPIFRRTLRARTDEPTRMLATAGLGLVGEARDIAELSRQLATATAPGLRRTTALAILTICNREPASLSGNSLGWVQQALQDPSWAVRADAAAVLAHSPDSQAVLRLVRLLGDSVPTVRVGAARALGLRRERSALVALRAGLADPDADVRTEVVKALAHLGAYLRRHGMGQVIQEVASWLPTGDSLLGVPEWQKAALLHVLGEDSGHAGPAAALSHASPDEQRLLLDMGFTDHSFLLDCLKSADFSIKLTAAGRLLEQKDQSGRGVIQEAVQHGGAIALTAYGLLVKLGEQVPDAPLQAGLQVAVPLADRLAVVAVAAGLPSERALALWQQAAHDPDRAVRRAVVDAVASSSGEGPVQWATPVLRTLLRDSDPRVRAQAAALLAGLLAPTLARTDSQPPAHEPQSPGPTGGPAEPAISPPASPAPSDPTAAHRDLGTGVAPDADPASVSGPEAAPFEQTLREGLAASKHHDYVRAQKLLLRARSQCTSIHPVPERCRTVIAEATWQLAQLHDQLHHEPEAMAEYQRLTADRQFATMSIDKQLAVQKAVVRLSLQLGQVVLSSQSGKRCHREIQWLTPGSKTVIVDGKPRPIIVRAGERQEVGECR